MLRDAGLEEAILANPDDPGPYEVYADWLQERGDPWGELIAIQLERERAPADPALAAREQTLLDEQGARWLGYPFGRRVVATWRRGFVDTIAIPSSYESSETALAFEVFAAMPVALLTRRVSLGVMCSYSGRGPDDVSILEALRDHPLPNLRELALDTEDQLSWTHVGTLAIAMPALARLESLEITAGRMTLGALDLPHLRSLRIETGGLPAHVLADLAAARWPRLESLVIYLGDDHYGGDCTLADTLPLLAGTPFPALRELALCNGAFADELARACATAPLLPRLHRLDLSKGTMGRVGAQAILEHAGAFAHLAALDLSENYLPADLAGPLSRVCQSVDLARQRLEDQYGRFVALGE